MISGDNNDSSYDDDIRALTDRENLSRNYSVLKYTAGLKAMLDVLPEDVESFPGHTIENYLWVIEILLQAIYDGLEDAEREGD